MAKEVDVVVKAVRRREPDLKKLARALIQLVMEEAGASAEHNPAEPESNK